MNNSGGPGRSRAIRLAGGRLSAPPDHPADVPFPPPATRTARSGRFRRVLTKTASWLAGILSAALALRMLG